MAGFGLRKNMVFEWRGGTFRIERLQPNGEVLLESINGGALSLVQRQQLLDDFAQGLISASTTGERSHKAIPTYSRPLEQLSVSARGGQTPSLLLGGDLRRGQAGVHT